MSIGYIIAVFVLLYCVFAMGFKAGEWTEREPASAPDARTPVDLLTVVLAMRDELILTADVDWLCARFHDCRITYGGAEIKRIVSICDDLTTAVVGFHTDPPLIANREVAAATLRLPIMREDA